MDLKQIALELREILENKRQELGRRVEMDDGYKAYPDQRVPRESWKLSTEGHFQVPLGEEG